MKPPSAINSERPAAFMLLCDDVPAATRARNFASRHSRGTNDQIVWQLELLEEPEAALQAARAAVKADVIVLSISNRQNIPSCVKKWLEIWLGSLSPRAATLVAMFDLEQAGPSLIGPMCDFLETVTRAAGARFETNWN